MYFNDSNYNWTNVNESGGGVPQNQRSGEGVYVNQHNRAAPDPLSSPPNNHLGRIPMDNYSRSPQLHPHMNPTRQPASQSHDNMSANAGYYGYAGNTPQSFQHSNMGSYPAKSYGNRMQIPQMQQNMPLKQDIDAVLPVVGNSTQSYMGNMAYSQPRYKTSVTPDVQHRQYYIQSAPNDVNCAPNSNYYLRSPQCGSAATRMQAYSQPVHQQQQNTSYINNGSGMPGAQPRQLQQGMPSQPGQVPYYYNKQNMHSFPNQISPEAQGIHQDRLQASRMHSGRNLSMEMASPRHLTPQRQHFPQSTPMMMSGHSQVSNIPSGIGVMSSGSMPGVPAPQFHSERPRPHFINQSPMPSPNSTRHLQVSPQHVAYGYRQQSPSRHDILAVPGQPHYPHNPPSMSAVSSYCASTMTTTITTIAKSPTSYSMGNSNSTGVLPPDNPMYGNKMPQISPQRMPVSNCNNASMVKPTLEIQPVMNQCNSQILNPGPILPPGQQVENNSIVSANPEPTVASIQQGKISALPSEFNLDSLLDERMDTGGSFMQQLESCSPVVSCNKKKDFEYSANNATVSTAAPQKKPESNLSIPQNNQSGSFAQAPSQDTLMTGNKFNTIQTNVPAKLSPNTMASSLMSSTSYCVTTAQMPVSTPSASITTLQHQDAQPLTSIVGTVGAGATVCSATVSSSNIIPTVAVNQRFQHRMPGPMAIPTSYRSPRPPFSMQEHVSQPGLPTRFPHPAQQYGDPRFPVPAGPSQIMPPCHYGPRNDARMPMHPGQPYSVYNHHPMQADYARPPGMFPEVRPNHFLQENMQSGPPMHRFPGPMGQVMPGPVVDKKTSMLMSSDDTSGEKKKTTKKSKAARALKKNEGDDKDKSPRKKKKRVVKVDDLNSKTDSDNSRSSNPVPSEDLECSVPNLHQDIAEMANGSQELSEEMAKVKARITDKKKKKPPATVMKMKKKRKKGEESDDFDDTGPAAQSPDDSVEKRRSSRNVKRKRYMETVDIQLSEDDSEGEGSEKNALKQQHTSLQNEEDNVDEQLVVEKILVMRLRKVPLQQPELKDEVPSKDPTDEGVPQVEGLGQDLPDEAQDDAENLEKENVDAKLPAKPDDDVPPAEEDDSKKLPINGEYEEVEEFYVKYKNYSYLHCEWKSKDEFQDKRVDSKIKRYKSKLSSMNEYYTNLDVSEPFNPDFVVVERVLDVSSHEDSSGNDIKHYLIKWCSLPYEDSTWETEADVPQQKVSEFTARCQYRPVPTTGCLPSKNSWRKLTEKDGTFKNDNMLRDYQLEGISWLLFNWYNRRNCILADEMGLGKTIQSITYLQKIFDRGIPGPFLVVAPLSTIGNWQREFSQWTDINAVVYHGSQVSREMIQTYEFLCRDENLDEIPGTYKMHAVITTYEMIVLENSHLEHIDWQVLIIDEAHRLKNQSCKLADCLRAMQLRFKVLLTGTPLQNNVEELFALLNFLQPEVFNSSQAFLNEFGNLTDNSQVQKLQELLKPMMLRRLKEDVEKSLAPKEETIIEVELTDVQKKYYRAILERNFEYLSKGSSSGNVPNLMNTMMELRKCCNHPYLIKGAEEKIFQEYSDKDKTPIELMIQSAGKLVLIDKLLPKLKSNGHKVLIFSQMVRCLDILEDYMVQHKYLYERIDGCVRGNDRQAAIDRFSKPDSDRFVFLLCTRAGGLGINLTAADTVIIFDSDWNPQNDLQAQARCHRIGQLKSVKIYRLITRNSYEREMFDKASLKLGLDKAVLQSISGRQDQLNQVQGPALSKQEVEDLLKRGAYGAIMDEDDDAKKFCEEDIDQILQRRAHTITIESGVKGSTFSKASFVSGEDSTDISLDDPNFWEKWAKKADLDISRLKTNKLIIEEPRRRKQTKRFGGMTGDDEVLAELGSESDSDYEEWSSSKKQKGKSKTRVWSRRECFRVEKNLLTFGWGRWQHILKRGGFPAFITDIEIEQVTRALLIYCLKFYNGDEKIKVFMWELITPLEHSANTSVLQNHEGLSAPVPRGRKGRRAREEADALRKQQEQVEREWVQEINVDSILQDDGFKKHLQHHCNKILLRVRMLYYLQSEIVGPIMSEIEETHYEKLELDFPDVIPDPPASWWDSDCDKCLLIGVCKHGYEKYNMIRADPKLCFLKKVGMPDNSALAADLDVEAYEDNDDPEYKPAKIVFSEYSEFEDSPSSATPGTAPASPISANEPNGKSSTVGDTDQACKSKDEEKEEESTIETSQETKEDPKTDSSTSCEWPSISEMNLRIRRMIASYQKHYKQIHARLMNLDRSTPSRFNDMSAKVKREQLRWTRREEADFYRTVSTFGVEYDKDANLCWKRFRRIAKLDRKSDDSLKLYYLSFRAMCERVCGKEAKSNEDPNFITVDQITEERASRTLYRIQLLNRIRLDVLRHEKLEERMAKCERSPDLPVWWKPGQHDKELILGMDKHGVTRTEIHILNDPTLSFLKSMREYESKEQAQKRKSRKRKIDHCEKDIAQSLGKTEEKIEIKEEKSDVKVTEIEDNIEEKDLKEAEQVKTEDVKKEETDKSEIEESSVATDSTEEKKEEAPEGEVQKKEDKGKEEDEKINTVENLLRRESLQEVIPHDSDSLLLFHTSYLYKWPKDRVLIQRVEHICYCVVHGDWPVQRLHEGALSFFNANPMATPMRPYSPASLKGFDTASEALLAAGKKDKSDSDKGKASTKQSYGSQRRKHGHDSRSSSPVISSLKNQQDNTSLSNLSKYASSSKSGKSNLLGMSDDKISGNSSMSLLARLEELSAQEKRMENDKAAAWQAAKQSNALLDLCMSNKQFSDTLQKLLKTDFSNMGLPLPNILSKNPQYSSKSSESSTSAEKSSTKSPKYSAASTSGASKSEKPSLKEASTPQKAPHTEPDAMFSRKQDTDNRSSKSKKLKKSRIGFISPAVLPSDTRIPVHNPSEGKKIGGEQAPMNRDLADWLTQHPGFVVDYKTLRQKLDKETSISAETEKETPTKLQPSSSSSSKRISTPVNSTPELPKMSKESRTDKQNAAAVLNDKNAYPPIDPAIAQLLLNMPMGLMDNYYGISPAALLAAGAFPTDLALPNINQDYENRSHSSSSNKYDQKRKKTSSSLSRHSDKSSAHDGSSKSHHSKDSSDYNRKKYESAGSSSSTMPSSASLQEEADAAMLAAALAGYLPNTGAMMGDPYQLMNMFQQPQLDPKLLSLYNLQMFPFFAGMQGVVNPLQGYPNLDMPLRNSFPSFSSNSKSSSSGNKSIESTSSSSSSSRNKKTKDSSNSSSQAIKQSLKNELPTHEALLSMSDALTSFHMNASNSAQLLNKFGLPNPATQFMMQAQLQELQKQLALSGDTSDLADAGYAFESSAQKAHQSHGRSSSKSSKSKDEPMDLTSIGKK